MRRLATHLVALIIVAAAGTTAFSQADKPQNEIEIRATFALPGGEANFSGTGAAGSTLDFNRDFDFGNEWGFDIKYAHRSENSKHKFGVEYANADWNRTRTFTRTFTFRGETYVAGAAVEGNLRVSNFKGMYAYRWGNDKVRIGPMIDFGIVAIPLDITGNTLSGTARKTEGEIKKFAATVGYDLVYDPTPKVNLFSNLGAIAFHHDRLLHFEGGVKFYPSRTFGVVGGYKYERYRWVDDANFLRITSNGPFVGGVLRF
jgi:hypothetical protein